MNIKTHIKEQYNDLSSTNKKIADFILNNLDECLGMTSMEIAQNCNASSASIIRFVKKIGFSGLDNFKISLAKSNSRGNMDTIISEDDDIKTLCAKVHSLINGCTSQLFEELNLESFQEAVKILKKSKHTYLLGVGSSSIPAYDLYHKLKRIGKNATFEFDCHMILGFCQHLTTQDSAIAFSYSGQTKELLYACEIAKERGSKIIAITRNKISPLSQLADVVINIPDIENIIRVGAFTSKYSSIFLNDLLYLGIIQENLTEVEDILINTNLLFKKLKKEKTNKYAEY